MRASIISSDEGDNGKTMYQTVVGICYRGRLLLLRVTGCARASRVQHL